MSMNIHTVALGVVMAVVSAASTASAQPPTAPAFRDAYDGDCTISIEVSPTADVDSLVLRLNRHPIRPLSFGQRSPLVVRLDERIDKGDVLVGEIEGRTFTTTVKDRPSDLGEPSGCRVAPSAVVPVWESRQAFTPTFYFGKAIDNFAPAEIGGYGDGVRDAVRSRVIGGIDLELRVWGSRANAAQIWVSAVTMNGVRSADINCNESKQATLCRDFSPTDAGNQFLRTIEHASSLEAHFAPRIEFFTINKDASTPVRLFVGGQFGFLALEGGAKVFEGDSIGGGGLAPKGPFRGSHVYWGWGRTTLFTTHAGWNRMKVRGTMVVDAFSGLADRFPVLRHFGFGSWRGFMAIAIDRNPKGDGPDSVQTYYGAAFDFEKAFSGR